VPLPLPVEEEVMVTQLALDTAVQPHSPAEVTFNVPVPPEALNDCPSGETVDVHDEVELFRETTNNRSARANVSRLPSGE